MEPGQTPNDQTSPSGDGSTPIPGPGQSITPSPNSTPTSMSYESAPESVQQAPIPPQPQPYNTSAQPVNPTSAQQPASQYFQSDPATMQQPASVTPTAVSRAGKGKKLLVLLVIILVLTAVGVGAYLVLTKKKTSTSSSTGTTSVVTQSYAGAENAALAALKRDGSSLTSSSLASINATDLFYAVFRNAAEQPIVTTTTNNYYTAEINSTTALPDNGVTISDVNQAGYDYKSGQFSYQSSGSGLADKCVNGVDYDISTDMADSWTKNTADDDDDQRWS
jgi:hypothetical protein